MTVTRSEWVIKCKPQDFLDMMNNTNLQKKLDARIDEYVAFKTLENEYQLYLSYKSMFLISSRDFVYQKKIKQINEEKNVQFSYDNYTKIWCEVGWSIEDFLYPIHPKKVRGEFVLSGNLV